MHGELRPSVQPQVEPTTMPVTVDAIERLCRRFMAAADPSAGPVATAIAGAELADLVLGLGRPAAPLPAPFFRSRALPAANVG